MTVINTVLARYDGGHLYVNRSGSALQRELYVEMQGVRSRTTAVAIAESIIANNIGAQEALAFSGPVRERKHVPTLSYRLGDFVDGDMILSMTITTTEQGATVVPELSRKVDLRAAIVDRSLRRASRGLTSEYARPVIQYQETGSGSDTTPPEFSVDGQVVGSFSPAWRVPRPWHCTWIDAQLVVSGYSATRVGLYTVVGNTFTPAAEYVIAPLDLRIVGRVNRGFKAGTRLVVAVTEPGVNAQKLTVSLRGAFVGG